MITRDARRPDGDQPTEYGRCALAVGRAVFGVGLFAGLLVLTAPTALAAHADDCASLSDCFGTASTAAQVVAGLAIVIAAAVLAVPALLRGSRGPSELHEAGVDQAEAEGASGGQGSGQGAPYQPQNVPGQRQGSAASGAQGGLNLPNLPDTPDVPLTPEVAGMMGTPEAEVAEAGQAERAREYTPQALDQMRMLGVSAADVEAVIRSGSAAQGSAQGSAPGTTVYSGGSGLVVILEATSGRVLTVQRR